jgi:hypothetical protein
MTPAVFRKEKILQIFKPEKNHPAAYNIVR